MRWPVAATAAVAAAAAPAAFPTKLTLGTDYYPEAWDSAMWTSDAQRMQAAGITNVRLAEFAWHSFQPNATSPILFDWLDSALSVLYAHGITAIIGTPTASAPAWLIASDPTIQYVDQNGNLLRYGSRQNSNHLHPVFLEATTTIVTAIAQHYANDPRVSGFQLDNEISSQADFSDRTLQAWQTFLQGQYGPLDPGGQGGTAALNAAWGTVFWSHTYNTWSEIPLPWNALGGSHNPGLALDCNRFLSKVALDYMQLQASILRQYAPSKPITTNLMGLHNGPDYGKLGVMLDFAAFDNYPLGIKGNWPNISRSSYTDAGLAAASMRCVKRDPVTNGCQPFYIMEEQDSDDGQATYYGNSYPEATRLMAWQQVANGADGVQFFRWRTTRVGFEQHWEGILDWDDSTENAKYPMVQRIGSEFVKASSAVFGRRVRAQVALLLSADTRWALSEQGLTSNPGFDVQTQLQNLFAAFKSHGLGVDVVYVPSEMSGAASMAGKGPDAPGFNLTGYDIVLAPTLWVVSTWLEIALKSYVAGGGHLFLSMRSGSKNGMNQYTNRTLPGPFADLAGIAIRQWDVSCGLGEVLLQSPPPAFTWAISSTQPVICEVLIPNATSTNVFGMYKGGYYDTRPALTNTSYGRNGGTVVYAGTVSDDAAFYEYIAAALAQNAGIPYSSRLPDSTEVSIRDAVPPATGYTVFALNYASIPMSITIPQAAGGTEVLSGTPINAQGVVNLGPWDVAVISVPA